MAKNENEKPITLDRLKDYTTLIIDAVCPVGSYMELDTDKYTPANLIPHTDWLPITDGTVLRAGGNDKIVGSDEHLITNTELAHHVHPCGNEDVVKQGGSTLGMSDYMLFPVTQQGPIHLISSTIDMSKQGVSNYPLADEWTGSWPIKDVKEKAMSIVQKSQNCYRWKRIK